MPSSSRVKHPEKHRQRRPELPRMNPVEQTSKILAPEIPHGIYKRASVRSHLTAITAESSVVSEDISVARREKETEEERYAHPKGRLQQKRASTGSFFIPGITGTARCLQQEEPKQSKRLSLSARVQRAAAVEHEADSIHDTKTSLASESRESKRSEVSHKSRGSRSTADRSHQASLKSNDSSVSSELDDAHLLYESVVDSIQSRREEGMIGLGEDEFQRMLQELEKDMTSTENVSLGDHPDLRHQVTSIRSLLNDYEGRKKVLKRRKQRESKRRSAAS